MIENKSILDKDYFKMIKENRAPLYSGYFIENNQLFYKNPPKMVNPIWDKETRTWTETSTLQEQVDYWFSEVKRLSRELAIAKMDNMVNPTPIEAELELSKTKHMELSHQLALEMGGNHGK